MNTRASTVTPRRSSAVASEARQIAKGLAFTSPWVTGFLIFTLTPIDRKSVV